MNFTKVADYDVSPLLAQLEAHPELWDVHRERKDTPGSPHVHMHDIWVRWRPRRELLEPRHYGEPHISEFYPSWYELPSLKPIIFDMMAQARSTYLGAIFITKIPPGKSILPHDDSGTWHAEYMNHKLYVPIKANDECVNYCGDEEVVMKAGECWTFNNLIHHSVENKGKTDRITLIVSMRVEG